MRPRTTLTLGLLAASGAVLAWAPARAAARALARSWAARVAVAGGSMEPTLQDGDWVLVDPDAYRSRSPRPGELVLAPDPREWDRLLIKRVADQTRDGGLVLAGDAPGASTDSRDFGAVDRSSVEGRPWFRYWPPARIGPLR